jgi:hypothetical protein
MVATTQMTDASDKGKNRATVHALVLLHVGALAAGIVAQHLLPDAGGPVSERQGVLCVVAGLVACGGLLAASTRRTVMRVVASSLFGVVSLTTLALVSILGTVVVQGAPPGVYRDGYGSLAPLVLNLFIDDVFHSLGFAAVMGLAAGAMVATLFRVGRWTVRRLGVAGGHLGAVVILAGAAVGAVWGVEGRLEMRVDETADAFVTARADGTARVPLGFSVRLDGFDLLRYDPEYRLRVFEVNGEDRRLLASFDPRDAGGLARHGARLVGYWPDHVAQMEVEPLSGQGGDAGAVAALAIVGPDPDGRRVWLIDRGSGPVEYVELLSETAVGFVWSAERAEALLAAGASSPHAIEIDGETVEVRVGETIDLPRSTDRLHVVESYVNLVIDPETRRPRERSREPNNPALSVEVLDESGRSRGRRWLFANHPSFHGSDPVGPPMRYVYRGDRPAFPGGALVVGELGQLWRVEEGRRSATEPLAEGGTFEAGGIALEVAALHERATARIVHSSRSDEPLHPVVEVVVGGERRFLGRSQAMELPGGRVLALAPRGDGVRDYISTMTVLREGREVLTRKVEVNHPLIYGGYAIYQSEYDPRDPDFSGFEVVRDPGLWLVHAGFVLMMAAVAHVILVVPLVRRLRRRARADRDEGERT